VAADRRRLKNVEPSAQIADKDPSRRTRVIGQLSIDRQGTAPATLLSHEQ